MDATFQNQIINKDGAFIVDELVNEGYYPHVKMSECMPTQEYIELPEVRDADLPDILSTTILEQGTNTVKVEFSVNNPSAETIDNIKIAKFRCGNIILKSIAIKKHSNSGIKKIRQFVYLVIMF